METKEITFIINTCQDIRTEGMKGIEELKQAYSILHPDKDAEIGEMMDAITQFTIDYYNDSSLNK